MYFYDQEIVAALVLWLALVGVVGFWAVRILTLLYQQRRAERAYRMQLAVAMGRVVREAENPKSEDPGSPGT